MRPMRAMACRTTETGDQAMTDAYYNEIDPRMAATLRVLIDRGHIARGIVDERSISDVTPGDLEGYSQCHFFAGIGIWSLACRMAGWPDDRPIWTGSCPCQPFSPAGKGLGFADERHLWPDWFHLIRERSPGVVVGEQVADNGGYAWFDLVSADMEGAGFAIGALVAPAASVGAPHQRHRTYFAARRVADAERTEPQQFARQGARPDDPQGWRASGEPDGRGALSDRLDHALVAGLEGHGGDGDCGRQPGRIDPFKTGPIATAGGAGRLADADRDGRDQGRERVASIGGNGSVGNAVMAAGQPLPGPVDGHWRDADWLRGRDGKWRAVEPGTFPLADGNPARVGRLHGYGNAIVAPLATEIIKCLI